MNRAERAAFVEKALTPREHEVVGQTIYDPCGNHRVRVEKVGSSDWFEMSMGEALQCIELLKSGVAHLTVEDGRNRHVDRPVRRGIE